MYNKAFTHKLDADRTPEEVVDSILDIIDEN